MRPSRLKIWLSVALLVGVMAVPDVHWLASVAIVVFFLPVMVWLAASAGYRSERPTFRILGDFSYPLYVIHIPVLAVLGGVLKAGHLGDPKSLWTYAVVPALLVAALVLDQAYDRPLRRMLAHLFVRAKADVTDASAFGSS